MIYLYSRRSGATDFEILEKIYSPQEWISLSNNVCKLLEANERSAASNLLRQLPFEVYTGTNFFNDDFLVLLAKVSIDEYANLKKSDYAKKNTENFAWIANTISELAPYIRFIVIDYDMEAGPQPVKTIPLKITSDITNQALIDAENLLNTSGAPSAVDRAHTAFHGFLEAVCKEENISFSNNVNISDLFKLIKEKHPLFHSEFNNRNVVSIIRSMSAIIHNLNPIRNHSSIAHPNEEILSEAEAMLVINSIRTLLHYLDAILDKKVNVENRGNSV